MSRKFHCDFCGRDLESDWTEEERIKETIETFGYHDPSTSLTACDDCWNAMNEEHPMKPIPEEERRLAPQEREEGLAGAREFVRKKGIPG